MVRHKDFGSGQTAVNSDEPITFTVFGETFRCKNQVQGWALLELIAEINQDDATAGVRIIEFLGQVMYAADFERFKALAHSDTQIIDITLFNDILTWVVEQYTARPTQQPEPSQLGEPTIDSTFRGVPSQPAASA